MVRLINCRVGVMFHASDPSPPRIDLRIIGSFGWLDDRQRELFALDQRERRYHGNLLLQRIAAILAGGRDSQLCALRRRFVGDVRWYGSEYVQSVFHSLDIDDLLISMIRAPNQTWHGLAAVRAWGDRAHFCRHEAQMIQLLHQSVGFLFDQPTDQSELPPRLRQVLDLLLRGEGEKQIAAQLGISRFTVHRHVTRLYRLLEVTSHPELMAHYAGLMPDIKTDGTHANPPIN